MLFEHAISNIPDGYIVAVSLKDSKANQEHNEMSEATVEFFTLMGSILIETLSN